MIHKRKAVRTLLAAALVGALGCLPLVAQATGGATVLADGPGAGSVEETGEAAPPDDGAGQLPAPEEGTEEAPVPGPSEGGTDVEAPGQEPGDADAPAADGPQVPEDEAPVEESGPSTFTEPHAEATTPQTVELPELTAKAHVQSVGDVTVGQGQTIGTVGKSRRLEAFSLSLRLPQIKVLGEDGAVTERPMEGGIRYQAYVRTQGWLPEAQNGAETGTRGRSLTIEAVRMALTGEAAQFYDLYYRVHMQGYGWLNWVKADGDGQKTGSVGYDRRMEAIEVTLVRKGAAGPASRPGTAMTFQQRTAVSVTPHCQSYGWRPANASGSWAGTTGQSKRMEAVRLSLVGADVPGGITYRVHGQSYGWGQGWRSNGELAGTTGRSKRVEALQVKLTGEAANRYDVYYRVHAQRLGTMAWAKNGEQAGSEGMGLRLEAVQVVLVPKGDPAPSASGTATNAAFVSGTGSAVDARGYVQGSGWTSGSSVGSTGQGRALQAVSFSVPASLSGLGSVQYNVHVSGSGWKGWTAAGTTVGTPGSTRVEAMQLRLTGRLADLFDVYYRCHNSSVGWLGWAKNGASAGVTSYGKAAESIQVRLVPKGGKAPANGSYAQSYCDQNTKKIGYQTPGKYPKVSSKSVLVQPSWTPPHNYVSPSRITPWATRQQCIDAFVARARDYLGTKYIEPYSQAPGQAVDCSGLVLQCLYATGMDMGVYNPYNHRWLAWQTYNSMNWMNNKTFMPVSLKNIQRGDVVYYQGHIAIYIGNGQIIDSWPNIGVTQRSMNFKPPIAAARPFA